MAHSVQFRLDFEEPAKDPAEDVRQRDKEPNQAVGSGSRDAMFQQAINLMSERCPSMALLSQDMDPRSQLLSMKTPPYGVNIPQYFYVQQNRPTPMPPLQAWRGYHGNVYFEPIKVKPASYSAPESPRPPELDHCSDKLQHILHNGKRLAASRSNTNASIRTGSTVAQSRNHPANHNARSPTRAGSRATKSSQSIRGRRQMVLLDKKAVLTKNNRNLPEDVVWLVGQESTGSLRIESARTEEPQPCEPPEEKVSRVKRMYDKDKICRGSVAHKIFSVRNKHLPLMSVNGDKYTKQQQPSALLRTQTQYSKSSQRLTLNSPDPYHSIPAASTMDKLPPLEQLRASLRHIDNATNENGHMLHVITPTGRLKTEGAEASHKGKPLAKYSPVMKHSSNKQGRPKMIQTVK